MRGSSEQCAGQLMGKSRLIKGKSRLELLAQSAAIVKKHGGLKNIYGILRSNNMAKEVRPTAPVARVHAKGACQGCMPRVHAKPRGFFRGT